MSVEATPNGQHDHALVPVRKSPVPFEQLRDSLPSAYIFEERGYNRAPAGTCMIDANTDVEVIVTWLREYDDSPRTQRSYKKEIERFQGWLALMQRKGLASVTVEDLKAYDSFMLAPDPDWCGDRYNRRGSSDWRPFEGPLSDRSCAHARATLGGFFAWLVEVGYLVRNPFVVGRRHRRKKDRQVRSEVASKSNYLSLPAFQKFALAIEQHVESIEPSERWKRAQGERQLFVVRFLANTGLRRDEITRVKMSHIRRKEHALTGKPHWTLKVEEGKGNKKRTIALNEAALRALRRYRQALDASETFSKNESPLLLPIWGERGDRRRFLTNQVVYEDVKRAIEAAQRFVEKRDPELAATLSDVTPHWFRHTCATILDQLGVKPKLIQLQLGHASLDTTMGIYTATEQEELAEALATLDI
jgi:integrase